MCGITAVWGESDARLTRDIMSDLSHRGPDDSGTAAWDGGCVGHRRLSIMDPRAGRQPICDENGACAIVANGEIYNFSTLKASLLPDHRFRTASDSEVPLHLYQEMGPRMVHRLDGMFSLILTDGEELFAARDTVGIKPLYYGYSGDRMVFASELKALCGRATDVQEFPPGSYFHSQTGFHKYRDIPRAEPENLPVDYWCRLLRATLERAVTKRLMSDAPLGAFLSGGLDSSIIAALARRHMKRLHTFSVGVEGSSDLEAARQVAQHIGSIHHEYVFTLDEVRRRLPEVLFHLESFDQDLVRSAVPCYFVSRLASQYVKVILTGEGADELFGGYNYYKELSGQRQLSQELHRSIAALHNINLQRVDRLTMAHSIEGRVPFLDLEMIELGQRIPARWKVRQQRSGEIVEKWILRKAFEDLLPGEIVWRDKEQFDEGSGTAQVLSRLGSHFLPRQAAEDYATAHADQRLRSREESVYHKLLEEAYSDASVVMSNVARWQDDRIGQTTRRAESAGEE